MAAFYADANQKQVAEKYISLVFRAKASSELAACAKSPQM